MYKYCTLVYLVWIRFAFSNITRLNSACHVIYILKVWSVWFYMQNMFICVSSFFANCFFSWCFPNTMFSQLVIFWRYQCLLLYGPPILFFLARLIVWTMTRLYIVTVLGTGCWLNNSVKVCQKVTESVTWDKLQ